MNISMYLINIYFLFYIYIHEIPSFILLNDNLLAKFNMFFIIQKNEIT